MFSWFMLLAFNEQQGDAMTLYLLHETCVLYTSKKKEERDKRQDLNYFYQTRTLGLHCFGFKFF